MLEFLLCSVFTILPDYLARRYLQGKRWGHEIDFFTMWYELRWGITACVLLTVALITLIFYYHPSTTNAAPFFRTVTILPENGGRVEEVFVENHQVVQAGTPLFSMLDSSQLAAVDVARSRVAEVEAAIVQTEADLEAAEGLVEQARGNLEQTMNELAAKSELRELDRGAISDIEIDRLENRVQSRRGGLAAAVANQQSVEARLTTVLPSQINSAREALQQAEVELGKTIVYAGISGRIQQFFLQPGDYVNPILRPAGVLIPTEGPESGQQQVQAGFNQLAAPVVKPGTLAELVCLSKPFTVIPMVVTRVQPVIAAGQVRPTDALIDIQDRARPGTLNAVMEPLYADGLEGVVPGTKCIANAYTYNHELIASGTLSTGQYLYLHMVDAVGIVHAVILRIQALILPVKLLVFAGH
jgi:multidrug resistance efflux pump